MRILALGVLLVTACCAVAGAQQPSAPASTTQAASPKTWFVRLIPSRATFLQDMTPAERKVMEEHFVYWKDLYAKGVCLFGGPVLDPKGPFGVLVIAADTEEHARALAAADPSVKAGINRIEVAVMQVAFPPNRKE
ncbi:MAG TPA: YciI family protein [Bryobacteraceae bacterium]|nr:YciI family protein [Bryobacteraceae bacterium]